MRALHYSLILVLSFAVVGCAEDALTTGSIEPVSNRGAIDTSKAARVEPIHALSSDTKRAWCEMRLRDVRAGIRPRHLSAVRADRERRVTVFASNLMSKRDRKLIPSNPSMPLP